MSLWTFKLDKHFDITRKWSHADKCKIQTQISFWETVVILMLQSDGAFFKVNPNICCYLRKYSFRYFTIWEYKQSPRQAYCAFMLSQAFKEKFSLCLPSELSAFGPHFSMWYPLRRRVRFCVSLLSLRSLLSWFVGLSYFGINIWHHTCLVVWSRLYKLKESRAIKMVIILVILWSVQGGLSWRIPVLEQSCGDPQNMEVK